MSENDPQFAIDPRFFSILLIPIILSAFFWAFSEDNKIQDRRLKDYMIVCIGDGHTDTYCHAKAREEGKERIVSCPLP